MIILIVVLIGVAIPFVLALFTKPEYVIECEITINQPKEKVFEYIRLLKNQEEYSKWVMTDPDMKKDLTGIDGTVGFIYAWDSQNKQAGKGAQEITAITGNERMDTEVRFEKPFKGTSYSTMQTESISSNQTKVKWTFTGVRNYMMKVLHYIINLKKVLAKDMQTSLLNLKNILEKQ